MINGVVGENLIYNIFFPNNALKDTHLLTLNGSLTKVIK
ncbi:hypothetical protein KL86DYS1_10323 [uncultured Dysgonomonas sp.]|uniref:Uncharacterized protein n=1 Tax=uncultured Dysgonomonas sp. TaxID=206096 RepID=A0A212IVZ8_9BACT|nr:hypothetical protein KL86DYS1_10323 [uncultured Dysgonomonas sp.]